MADDEITYKIAEDVTAETVRRERAASRDAILEVVSAILLSVAGLAISWTAFESTRWQGEQTAAFARADALRVAASRQALMGDGQRSIDIQLTVEWMNAKAAGKERLAGLYRRRMRPEFQPAFQAWLATDPLNNGASPAGPLLMPEYRLVAEQSAKQMAAEADAKFNEAKRANDVGNVFLRATLSFTAAMYVAGVSQSFKRPKVRISLLAIALIAVVAGMIRAVSVPVLPLN